jgi:hypothetical protein
MRARKRNAEVYVDQSSICQSDALRLKMVLVKELDMTGYEIAAIIGALAWLPFLIDLTRKIITRPSLLVIPSKAAEIGLTTFGPICNLRVAFAASKKDIVITDIKLRITHSDGDTRLLSWQGLTQNLGQYGDINRGIILHEKEYSVLAIKIRTTDIEERFIQFQNTEYLKNRQTYIDKANEKIETLKNQNSYSPEAFTSSDEIQRLIQYCSQNSIWKPGEYKIEILIKGNVKFRIKGSVYKYDLQESQISMLDKNKAKYSLAYKNDLVRGIDGYAEEEIIWNWCYPLLKTEKGEFI